MDDESSKARCWLRRVLHTPDQAQLDGVDAPTKSNFHSPRHRCRCVTGPGKPDDGAQQPYYPSTMPLTFVLSTPLSPCTWLSGEPRFTPCVPLYEKCDRALQPRLALEPRLGTAAAEVWTLPAVPQLPFVAKVSGQVS